MRYLFILLILFSFASKAAGPKFGPEFTFAKNDGGRSFDAYRDLLNTHLIHNQPAGEKFTKWESMFISPDGWVFDPKTDQGVIEVAMDPMTYEEYSKYASDIQDAIFVSANNTDHFAQLFAGGGHISIDFNYFDNEPLLLRNFLIDMVNHSELAMGIWSYDTHNALAMPLLAKDYLFALKDILELYDKDLLEGELIDTYELARAFHHITDRGGDPFQAPWYGYRHKNTAINLNHVSKHIIEKSRIEIRSVRPQPDFQTFLNQIRLITKRLEYLKKFDYPIPIKLEVQIDPHLEPAGKHMLTPPIEAQDALRAFYKYVRESKENWADHRGYIWPMWITDGSLKKFESSAWFKYREFKRACSDLLSL
jgi:hypothetical protein